MISIPQSELDLSFSRSSGPGGQNANKLNTKVTMSWNISSSSSCPNDVKERFIKKFNSYIANGIVTIKSQKFRTQKLNIEDCKQKLQTLLNLVEFPPKKRRPTKPSKSAIQKRINSKKLRGLQKKLRSKDY